jgi:hypothetical protein
VGLLDGIKRLFGSAAAHADEAKADARAAADGEMAVATRSSEDQRETSTNAQMMGSSDEPWPGND